MSPDVVKKNSILLSKGVDAYLELRHIILRGANREIGKALGNIAQKSYGSQLIASKSKDYWKEKQRSLKKHPSLLERALGVAEAFPSADERFDPSCLYYDVFPKACSAIFIPGSQTESGHSILYRNMDFYMTGISEFMGLGKAPGENELISRDYVLELYPDSGYSSICLGTFDLLNGAFDGVNSEGLAITLLVDNSARGCESKEFIDSNSLSILQLARAILDSTVNIKEAKQIVLDNEIIMPMDPLHIMIMDSSGESLVVEYDKSLSPHFTKGKGIQPLTNHAIYEYPKVSGLPKIPEEEAYNTFNRYRRVAAYISKHKGKYSKEDAIATMKTAYAFSTDSSEGAALPIPLRTLWNSYVDLNDGSIEARFYRKDLKNRLLFSKSLSFSLGN